MHRHSITRMTAPVACVSLILVGVAWGSAWYIHSSQRSLFELLSKNVAGRRAALDLEIVFGDVQLLLDRVLLAHDQSRLDAIAPLFARAEESLKLAESAAAGEEEADVATRIRAGSEAFFCEVDRIAHEPPQTDALAQSVDRINTQFAKKTHRDIREYLSLKEQALSKATVEHRYLSRQMTIGLLGLGLCGAGAGILGGLAIAVTLSRSLHLADVVLRDTADQLHRAAGEPLEPQEGLQQSTLERMTYSASAVLQRLQQTERDALRAEQLAWAGQMAAGIAHEVRNPLMVIKLLVQTAAESKRPGSLSQRDVGVLEEEIVRLERIVATFLDFARPPRPEKSRVRAAELLASAVDSVRPRADRQSVTIDLATEDPEIVVEADSGQLRQVAYNLLFNALDVLRTGGRIQVVLAEVESAEAGPPEIEMRFEDDGPGLPEGGMERIFDPFVSTKETGLGLGLSICRRIVEAHGGTIVAANRPTGGAGVVVRLPGVARSAEER